MDAWWNFLHYALPTTQLLLNDPMLCEMWVPSPKHSPTSGQINLSQVDFTPTLEIVKEARHPYHYITSNTYMFTHESQTDIIESLDKIENDLREDINKK